MNKQNIKKIISFVRLDFYLIKPYAKPLLTLLALGFVMTAAFQSLIILFAYVMAFLIIVMMYPFSVGEMNRTDTLYSTLALNRRNIVAGRYIFILCLEIITILLTLAFSWVFSIFTSIEFTFSDILFPICVLALVFSLMAGIQYPFYFKLGYNKAKFVAVISFLIIFVPPMSIPFILRGTGSDINIDRIILKILEPYPLLFYILPVIGSLVLFFLSYLLSCRLYKERDI